MIRAIRHTGLVVQDLPAALHFWCKVLGFQVARQMDEQGPHIDAIMEMRDARLTTAKLTAPDGRMVELLKFHTQPDVPRWTGGPASTGFTHIAMTVSDLDETCRTLANHDVSFSSAPQTSPDGFAKLVYARGPEGVLLELVEELKK